MKFLSISTSTFALASVASLGLGCSSGGGSGPSGGSFATGGSSSGGNAQGGGDPSSGGVDSLGGGATIGGGSGLGGGESATGGALGSIGGSPGGGSDGGSGGAEVGVGGSVGSHDSMYVEGRFLHDACGEKVILRGVNEMIVWSPGKDGATIFPEIAETGANVVRIVWTVKDGTAAEMDLAITNAIAQKLIPMVELHDATGDLTLLPGLIDYWTSDDVVAVLKKHQKYVLVNIGNEVGDDKVTEQAFSDAYKTAITRMRDKGLVMPFIIDGSSWGQNIDMLQATGPGLITHDPLHNLLFSVHMWWSDADGTRVKAEIKESVDMGLPLMVGEFAQHAVYLCDQAPFAYQVLMSEAKTNEIGWLAWSWGAVPNNDCAEEGSFDMTTDGSFGNWEEEWGGVVAVSDPNSIQNTSVRPASIAVGACR